MKKILGIMLSIVAFLVVSMMCLGHTLADTDAVILFLKGEVGVKAVGTDEWVDAYKGMELSSGDTVRTGRHSWVEIDFGGMLGNIVKIDKDTEMTVSKTWPIRLNLMEGNIFALVEKIDKGSTFEIRTPTAVCGVRGSGMGTETDGKKTIARAYENDAFAKGIRKDGSVIEDNIIIKQGHKTTIKKFKKPSKLKKLSAKEKKIYGSWREKLDDRLGGAIGAGKPAKLKKLGLAAKKFGKVMDKKDTILEKKDLDKIDKKKKKSSGSSCDKSYEHPRE